MRLCIEPKTVNPGMLINLKLMSILIVDRFKVTLALMSYALRSDGHFVESAGDGNEALKMLSAGLNPGMIIVDTGMQDMDAVAFVKAVRMRPETAATPMLILAPEVDSAVMCADAGATGWIIKPVTQESLLKAITMFLFAG